MKKIYLSLIVLITLSITSTNTLAQYCTFGGPGLTGDSNTETVDLTGDGGSVIAYAACPGVAGVEDQTGLLVSVTASSSYTANIQFGTCGGTYGGAGEAWIDWNQNDIFDASESIGTWTGTPPVAPSAFGFTVPAGAYNGNTRMRVMQWESGALPLDPCGSFNWGSVVDFTVVVSGGFTPTCIAPSSLTATSIATTTADLSWTSAEILFDIELGAAGFTPTGTPTSASVINPYSLTGLTANTPYDYYVRADCGANGTSTWVGPYSFSTLCNTASLTYTQDFSTWPIPCWDLTGGTQTWGDNGSGIAEASFWGWPNPNDAIMTSEAINISVDARVRFDWSHSYSASYPLDSLNVEVKVLPAGTWVSIWGKGGANLESNDGAGNTTPGSMVTETIILAPGTYTGNDIQIRFVANSGYGPDLFVDNLVIDPIPTCIEPTVLTATGLTATAADLGWTDPTGSLWDIELGAAGFTPTGTPTTFGVTTNPFNVTGLTAATSYDFYVRSDCGANGRSAWTGPFSFVTNFNAPTGVTCVSGGNSSVVFSEEFDANSAGWTGDIGNGNGQWEIPDAATSGNTGANNAHSGANYMNYEASSTATNQGSIVSPAIDLTYAQDGAELSFWMHAYGASMGTLNIGVGTSPSGPFNNEFSWTGQYQTAGSDPWANIGVDLSAYIGQPIYIELTQIDSMNYLGSGYDGDMSIDLFEVTTCIPTCNISVTASGNDATTYGGSDGDAMATVTGGQGNVTYMWSNGGTTAMISGLIAGTYDVTVMDDILAACEAVGSVIISEPAPTCNISVTVSGNDATTYGGSDGDATATLTGGQGNVTYMWSNGGTTAMISGLIAGTYDVTVMDDILAGCADTLSVQILEPAPTCNISVTASGNDATTYGGSDGDATATVTGGQGTVTYMWSNGGTTAMISGLTAGTYDVTVMDDILTGCADTLSVQIIEPAPTCNISLTTSGNDASTTGGSDGDAMAMVTGGQGTVTYMWSNGGTTAMISGLIAGTYDVTVMDDILTGCEALGSVIVSEPPAGCSIAVTASGTNVTSNGGSDGSASSSISGELGNITYAWSNGETTSAIVNITAGIYTVTVTDDTVAGCSASATVTITEPALTCDILANLSVTAATTAGGSDGAAEALVSGAQGNLTYMWSNGGTTSMITGLPTNTYSVTVTDDVIAGCTASASGLVTDPSVTVSCNLSVTASSIDPTAFGASDGSATAVAAGNQGNLSYLWDNAAATQVINGLAGGIFTVTVTDDITAGCAVTASVTLTEPAATCNISLTASGNDVTNAGGSDGDAMATVTGGQGTVTYMWSNGATTSMISGLIAGTYGVTVMDDVLLGCEATASVIISEPVVVTCTLAASVSATDATLNGASDGTATATVSGEQGVVTYSWSNSETTASITGLIAGTYTVIVTDDATADCFVIDTVIVGEPQSIGELNNSIEMTLYPNPNSGNFVVSISEAGNYNVVIRNVIGQTIKSDLINGTTAEFRLNNVESGIYFVTIQSDGFERTEKIVIK